MDFQIGDIILSNYKDFKGDDQYGLFMVIYDEKLDVDNGCNLNLTCIKITTQTHDNYKYYYELKQGEGNLNQDCRACCSKVYTLHKGQVSRVTGHLPNSKIYDIMSMYNKYQLALQNQIMRKLGGL